jgi:hypothetical protein
MQDDGTVGPHGEKRAGAEIGVSGVAAENVPSGGQYDELQDLVNGEEIILVADQAAGQKEECDRDNERDSPEFCRYPPPSSPEIAPLPHCVAMREREGPSPQGWEG